MDVRDATAELEDLAARARLARTGGAQVVDREADRARHALEPALLEQAEDRGHLEERADDAAVDRREARVADELGREGEHAFDAGRRLLDVHAEEARVRDRGD